MEHNKAVVPEPLIGEIEGFLATEDPRLHRRLRRKGKLEACRVLDVLLEAEEKFLPGTAQNC